MYSGLFGLEKKDLISALIGAGISIFLLKTGILSLFFLVPLGFVAFSCHYKTAWFTFALIFLGNLVLILLSTVGRGISAAFIGMELLYFSVMTLVFTWITAPPPDLPLKVSGPLRLIAGSCIGAMVFSFIFLQSMKTQGFMEYVDFFIRTFTSASRSSGTDVVQSAMLEMITAEYLVQIIRSVMLRGGSIVSCLLLFFVSRQISFLFARVFLRVRRIPGDNSLAVFHVYPTVIWAFSASLLLVVFTRMINLQTLEILLWNVLIICAILYLVQGLGILQFFLARPETPTFMRLLFTVLFIVILFSPFLNALLLGGLILLGVAENWAPLRVSNKNGPPSTPEAGDGSLDD